MGSSLKRRSLTSAIGATVVVSAALALFSFATWAGRNQDQAGRQRLIGLQDIELQIAQKMPKPAGFERPEGRSPLEGIETFREVTPGQRKKMIDTPIGLIDPAEIGRMRTRLPALAGTAGRSLGEHGKRGEIAPGFDAVQISESALASRSLDYIATELPVMMLAYDANAVGFRKGVIALDDVQGGGGGGTPYGLYSRNAPATPATLLLGSSRVVARG